MSTTVRSALRVVLLTAMLLSASAVGQSYLESTGPVETGPSATAQQTPSETDTAAPVPKSPTEDETTERSTTTARETPPASANEATATPLSNGRTNIDVESRFERAKSETLPGENWSAQRVRSESGQRGLTVVTTQGFYVSGQTAEIAALTPDGSVVYFNDSYRVYFDVDPVEGERYTVEYVAARHFEGLRCRQFDGDTCTRNVVVRANMTTGEEELLYAEMTERVHSARWHDVDRINESHLLVADIVQDSVFAVDTRDDSVAWEWDASENYSQEVGGVTGDWTHVNDVELLDDGRVMVSPRNMDEVIFLDETDGDYVMDDTWTLGEDENHSILYEQHNPDYIPREDGGPSVLVADSENTRVVEYQRVDGEWIRTWAWRDLRLQWPRDADRLPNGNTLVVDSHGNRIVEVDERDRTVWSLTLGMPYDVERIGTGHESSGGPAARFRQDAPIQPLTPTERSGPTPETPDVESEHHTNDGIVERGRTAPTVPTQQITPATGTVSDRSPVDRFWFALKRLFPARVLNGLLYLSPPWVLFTDLAFAGCFVLVGLTWGSTEFYWSRHTLRGGIKRVAGLVERVR